MVRDQVEFDLALESGRIRARSWGEDDAPLLLCGHGLSSTLMSFAFLAPQLARAGRRVVAVDFRGRGRSDVTPPGTYGMAAHARDLLEAATALGAERFDYAGWSMGALIGLRMLAEGADRVRTLGLIDHAGRMDREAEEIIRSGLARLDVVAPTPDDYVGAVRSAGWVTPWTDFWDGYYRYELEQRPDGTWSPSSDRAACAEDLDAMRGEPFEELWLRITMPTVLIRANRGLAGGLVVPAAERDALLAAAPDVRVVEVPGDHYDTLVDERTVAALRDLLR
jgi:pimeloyl-ACP methyl ester carboxylesterase